MKLSRREFLSLLAAAGSTACVGGSDAKERSLKLLGAWPDGVETWTPTICRECPAGCGLLGRVVDGRVVGLVGNPLHPVNRGAICARGVGALQTVYDSKRFEGPLIRRRGKLVRASWDEALTHVGEHLHAVRGRRQPERVSIVVGDLPGIRNELWTRFARAYGTPNLIRIKSRDPGRASVAERLIYGVDQFITYDWPRADLVLSFGRPLLDGGASPVLQHRQRADLARHGGRLIQVESRLSATAARADDWLAIIPGSEAALALSLARILVERGLHDPKVTMIPGFEPWVDAAGETQPGFREWLRGRYEPAWCEKMTGLDAKRIVALGADLAEAQSPIVLFEADRYKHVGGLYSQIAFAALNLLIGAPGRTGGLHSPGVPPAGSVMEGEGLEVSGLDEIAAAGLSTARLDGVEADPPLFERDEPVEWAERLATHNETAVDTVLVDNADPLGDLPNGATLAREFGRVPMVVVLATAPNATTERADVVLPSSHFLESWSEEIALDVPGQSVYSVAQPVLDPQLECRPAEEILAALASAWGFSGSEVLPTSMKETIRRRADRIHQTRRGRIGLQLAERPIRRELRERVETSSIPRSGRRFFRNLLDVGVWVDTEPADSAALAASFAGPVLDRQLARVGLLRDQLEARLHEPEAIYLPHFEGPVPKFKSVTLAQGSSLPIVFFETAGLGTKGSQAPWLQETLSPISPASWSIWIELNPRTASLLKIRHMQRVRVSTSSGEVEALASLTETARPGYLYLPLGTGADSPVGRVADARFLIERAGAPFTGLGLFDGTLARVIPV